MEYKDSADIALNDKLASLRSRFSNEEIKLQERALRNMSEYQELSDEWSGYWTYERDLNDIFEESGCEVFSYSGYCIMCNTHYPLVVDFRFANIINGKKNVNWPERLVCPNCRLNSRQRYLTKIIFDYHLQGKSILSYEEYPYRLVKREVNDFSAVSYAGPGHVGMIDGLDCVDICNLPFDDESFDLLVASDTFHVAHDYRKAFKEGYRVLKYGGKLSFIAPFFWDREKTEERARFFDGNVYKFTDAIYSGNPAPSLEPRLIYQVFGWDVLDSLKKAGFEDAYVKAYYSMEDGYMGYLPICIEAIKGE